MSMDSHEYFSSRNPKQLHEIVQFDPRWVRDWDYGLMLCENKATLGVTWTHFTIDWTVPYNFCLQADLIGRPYTVSKMPWVPPLLSGHEARGNLLWSSCVPTSISQAQTRNVWQKCWMFGFQNSKKMSENSFPENDQNPFPWAQDT